MPPKASTQSDLGAGFERIKQYPGEEQVRLSVIVNIPGGWFGGGDEGSLTARERKDYYESQAAVFDPVHSFGKTRNKKASNEAAIRFLCISDASDDASHEGYWIPLAQWNRYRHDTYKDRRDDELPFIVAPSDQAAAQPTAPEEKTPTGILAFFEVVKTGPHTQKKKSGGTKIVQCTWYRCTQPGCKRKEMIREVSKGTGQLFRELKTCNNLLWRKLRLESRHSKVVMGADGLEVELMSFNEALPHHIRFVAWCVRDWQPFSRSRSKGLKEYVRGLNPRAGLPHRETCLKILGVMRTLTDQKLQLIISKQQQKFGEPFAGSTSDVWSMINCTSSYFCMRLNLVLEPDMVFTASSTGTRPTTLVEAAPMIAFRVFTETKHSGKVLATVKTEALAKFNMGPASLSLMTEDGASNNKAAAKIINAPFKVCSPHDLQRAVLFATGLAGTVSKNVPLKDFVGGASRMAAAPHRSTKTSSRLQEAQIEGGTPKRRVLTTQTKNETRWTGLFRMAHAVRHSFPMLCPPPSSLISYCLPDLWQNRQLEKCLSVALTGSETGLTAELPGVPASEDEADSDADDLNLPVIAVDDDEAVIIGNEAAGKDYPLAHRLLDARGFLHNSMLESVLTFPHEVCLLLQKDQGVSLSMAWQMMRVLRDSASSPKLLLVSGLSKEGDWKEVHSAHLPEMFQKFRTILVEQLDERFHCSTTPDKPTLLSLAFDPSVDTSAASGIFCERSAAQQLMEGEHRRALHRRQHKLRAAAAPAPTFAPAPSALSAPSWGPVCAPAPAPALAPTPSQTGKAAGKAAGKRPAGVLAMMKPSKVAAVSATTMTDPEKVIDDEIAKYTAIRAGVLAEGPTCRFYDKQMFDHKRFWYEHRNELPLHYNTYVPEVGSPKAASANVETVFSGVGGMTAKAMSLGAGVTADYTICHHNWQYEFFTPTEVEVAKGYETLYGAAARNSDAESSSGSGSDSDSDKADGDEE